MLPALIHRLARPRLLGLRSAIGILLAIHLLAGLLLTRLDFNNAPETYIAPDAPAARQERALRAEFPNDETLIALFAGPDLYAGGFLAALHRTAQRLERHALVDRVFAVTTVERIAGTEDGFTVEPLIDPAGLDAGTPESRRARVLADRFAPGLLAARDGSALALVVRPKVLEQSRQRAAVADALRAAVRAEGLAPRLVAVAGPVPLDVAELDSMLQDTVMFTPLVVLLGLQLLLWVVGRLAPVLIGAVAMSTVVVSAVALVAALGQPYTLVTAMVPTLLAAYTVANLLHLYAALQRMRQAGHRRPRRVLLAMNEVQRPTLYNVLSTMAGMLSLTLIPIPPIQVFGVVGAFGVAMIYLTLFWLLPPLLVQWDRGPWPRGGGGFAWTRRIAFGLARFSMRRAGWVLAGVALASVAALPQALKVSAETDLLRFFADDHPLTRSTRLVEARLSGVTALELVADGRGRDAFKDADTLKRMQALQDWVAALPEVDRATSMMDIVAEMNWAFHGEDPAWRRLPDDPRLLAQLLLIYDGRDLNELVNREYQRTRILLSLNVHGANAIEAVMDKIEARLAAAPIPGVTVRLAGYGRLLSDQEDLLVLGQQRSFLGAFGQIFLILLVLWRSLPAAVIGMLPNLAPLYFVFVAMGALGIHLDMATVLIASVVLGITVDDTIHFIHHYLERRRQGRGTVFALARSFEASGRAVLAISLLLVAQFLLLAGSRYQPSAHFGLLAATGLLAGQLLELLLLPALIVLWSRVGGRRLS